MVYDERNMCILDAEDPWEIPIVGGKLFQMDDVRPKMRSLDSWILPELDPIGWRIRNPHWILVKPQQPSRYFHRRASQATQGFLDHMKTRDAVPRLWCWVLGECEWVHVCLNDIHIYPILVDIYIYV